MNHRPAIRRLLAERARREKLFPGVTEAAWTILLDLWLQSAEGQRVSVTSACYASRVPATSALRHISILTSRGLVCRAPDLSDQRRTWLELTPHAGSLIDRFFAGERANAQPQLPLRAVA